ncbi:ABC transporter substrate-binding protein [Devosia sp. ZW T5_3]|uniref:ABC transporter substrate-binding protein n=1 Tax=Devosia sp. ZW T5_3 TaxID=3378085 RepID=UPI0038529DBF
MPKNRDFELTRRHLLMAGAAGLLAGGLPRPLFAQETAGITTAFGWISNVEYAGFWAALDQGYFTEEGLDAPYLAGGPNAPDVLVSLASDAAQVAFANWMPLLDAIGKGNDFQILGSAWAKSPSGLLSLAANPVRTPQDLVGKRILAQNPSDTSIFDAVLAKAGLPLDYEVIPTGFSPEPLLAGDGDVYLCFATNQPITLENMGMVQGQDFIVTLFDDIGYVVKAGLMVAKKDYVAENRETLVKYTRAMIKGWEYAFADPAYAAQIVVDNYGADLGLDLAQQTRQMELQIPLMKPAPDYKLYLFDPADITGNMTEAAQAVGRTVPPLADLVDFSIAEEAYATL